METETIDIRADVYERLRARKREDESFTDLVDRLIDESSADWEETFDRLPDDEATELDSVARASRERAGREYADRQREAIDAFAEMTDEPDEELDDA